MKQIINELELKYTGWYREDIIEDLAEGGIGTHEYESEQFVYTEHRGDYIIHVIVYAYHNHIAIMVEDDETGEHEIKIVYCNENDIVEDNRSLEEIFDVNGKTVEELKNYLELIKELEKELDEEFFFSNNLNYPSYTAMTRAYKRMKETINNKLEEVM